MDPIEPGEMVKLLSREDFGEKIATAIKQTTKATATSFRGREYGFVGLRDLGTEDKEFHLTSLFEGEERTIPLWSQADQYIYENPEEP
ncbi:hypothetical protein HYW46_02275 [Candidatus Daviesbacteria bacterium]|nr:hypothetical protein [Candidatus Daviesbacteria bacterium]